MKFTDISRATWTPSCLVTVVLVIADRDGDKEQLGYQKYRAKGVVDAKSNCQIAKVIAATSTGHFNQLRDGEKKPDGTFRKVDSDVENLSPFAHAAPTIAPPVCDTVARLEKHYSAGNLL